MTTDEPARLLAYLRSLIRGAEAEIRFGRAGAVIPPPGAGVDADLPLDDWTLAAAADGVAVLNAARTLTAPAILPIRFLMPGDHRTGSDHPGYRPKWLADGYRLIAAIAEADDFRHPHRGRRMRVIFPDAVYRMTLDGARTRHHLEIPAGTAPLYITARAAGDTAR